MFFHFLSLFFHFLSFSFIFYHFLSFFHFLSFSFIFFHFLSFSFIFFHFLSFSFIFFHFLSSSFIFSCIFLHFLPFSFILFVFFLSFSFPLLGAQNLIFSGSQFRYDFSWQFLCKKSILGSVSAGKNPFGPSFLVFFLLLFFCCPHECGLHPPCNGFTGGWEQFDPRDGARTRGRASGRAKP